MERGRMVSGTTPPATMACQSCGHENRAANRFCEECGATLARRCGSCGGDVPPTAKFCGACGAPADPVPGRVGGGGHATDVLEARKVVTIVFADLIGSTALHERLDADSARAWMDRYYRALHAVVEAHGGSVVKLLGDGVMAAFGLPRVAEDDAIRAVRAAVAMQQACRALAREHSDAVGAIGLRVAVNTGEVVVNAATDDVVGDPINVAARLQEAARDGDVVLGDATRRLVGALVTLAPLGSVALKGRAEEVAAYRVVSLERPGGAAAVAFVGREDELARLAAVYEAARAAPAARLAVVLGSPGLGKSRLLEEFSSRLPGATVLTASCEAAGGATFAPLARALRAVLGLRAASGGAPARGRPHPPRHRHRLAACRHPRLARGDLLRYPAAHHRSRGGAACSARARRSPLGRATAARPGGAPGAVDDGRAAAAARRGTARAARHALGAGGARAAGQRRGGARRARRRSGDPARR